MHHDTPLIATIVSGLVLAFIFGALANRMRVSPLAGYLLAGVVVGPHTPGFVADANLAGELAEIGVILLMFGVGLHFSLKDLMSVKAIAIPGAIVQIASATVMGWGLAELLGWPLAYGLIFGLTLSTASTVVLLRAMQERRLLQSERGRIAVGWLIVEDVMMILTLVLIPALAETISGGLSLPSEKIAAMLGITLGKVAVFVALMLVVGRWIVPRILHAVAHTGSRELFRLAVLAIALGIAFGAARLFDVSFALGAFFAGMVLAESELSQRATEETLPLRDAFAVLFFVSVGMLFDPDIIVENPLAVVGAVLIVMVGKSIAAFLIVRAFGYPTGTALTISASLAQIGEFSFIMANLAVALGLLHDEGRSIVLAAAMISILLNPAVFALAERARARVEGPSARKASEPAAAPAAASPEEEGRLPHTALSGHAVLVGYGNVGSVIAATLRPVSPLLVIDENRAVALEAAKAGFETLWGAGVHADVQEAANVAGAAVMYVAVPDGFEAGQIVARARALNPALRIVARAYSEVEAEHLIRFGANDAVIGEREIGLAMTQRGAPPPPQEPAAEAPRSDIDAPEGNDDESAAQAPKD